MIQILEVIFSSKFDVSNSQNLKIPVSVSFVLKIQLNSALFHLIQILEVVFDKIIVFATLQNLESLQKSKFYTIFANL